MTSDGTVVAIGGQNSEQQPHAEIMGYIGDELMLAHKAIKYNVTRLKHSAVLMDNNVVIVFGGVIAVDETVVHPLLMYKGIY